jgi:hypothetical protein
MLAIASAVAPLCACGEHGTPLSQSEIPRTRPGLWEEVWVVNGATTPKRRFCDPGAPIFPPPDSGCTKYQVLRIGADSWVLDDTCKVGDIIGIRHRAVSGDLTTNFSANGVARVPSRLTIVIHESYHYVGACPPGMPPGKPSPWGSD